MPSEARSEDEKPGLNLSGGNSHESAAAEQTAQEKRRADLEAELRAVTREYENELLALFDRLPKWHSAENEGEPARHHYWNGHEWVEYELDDPPLWAVENIDLDALAKDSTEAAH